MATTTDTAPETAGRELTLTRLLDAPRPLVFRVWSKPEHLARWWGPKDFLLPKCEMDFRPGGSYRFLMRSPEGTEHRLQGVYREIEEPERLAFTWGWVDEDGERGPETLVTVTLEEVGDKTRLTLHQAVFESETARDLHEGGWTECLDRLVAYAEQQAA